MFRKLSVFNRKRRDTYGQLEVSSDTLSINNEASSSRTRETSPYEGSLPGSVPSSRGDVDRKDASGGPLGLSVVYVPPNGHKVDIVFIHGLGGTSRYTWSQGKEPKLFWPLTFLAMEPDICLARIMTFGYNATLRKTGRVGLSMLDFAKDLLFDLKYARDEQKEELNVGNVPLIFVVHSMGGLVVKEAYMQGQNDPEYASIVKAITAIAFLATPHRGSNLAQTLNRILQSTVVLNSKQYIAEISKNSLSLQKLNEQFRHIAPRLDIVSFYETQPTPIALKNMRVMILEKDSSVLGYPGELSKALNADHHGVCKYDSPKDPNYIAVRNVLKSIVSKIIASSGTSKKQAAFAGRRNSLDLKAVLSITDLPSLDYSFFYDQWLPGTSEWILQEEEFIQWRYAPPEAGHRLLWLNGGPGRGKSVVSSFIINSLVGSGASCQYFFIRFGDRKKRTLNLLLRSIAYQVAQCIPEFMTQVIDLAEEAIRFESAEPRVIWVRIFKSILFVMGKEQQQASLPLFWVVDGLDEAEDPRSIVRTLSEVSSSVLPIRVMIVGRPSPEMGEIFRRVPDTLKYAALSIEGRQESDFQRYVQDELRIPGSSAFRQDVVQRILLGAQNNFLWVRLAIEKANRCHRQVDVEEAFQHLPAGMEALYDRMASSIAQLESQPNRELALAILQFTSCALRDLTVAQLSQALGEDTSDILDIERSIVDLCRGFVVIDNSGIVSLIHHTAREYLLAGKEQALGIDRGTAHEVLFASCMNCLMKVGLRAKVTRNGHMPEFLDYAATSWPMHLDSSQLGSQKTAQMLSKFTTGMWILTWIEYLASTSQLRVLIKTSKHLSSYETKLRARYDYERPDEADLLESWSVDLVKIVGKFGTILLRNPSSIYKRIAPFCPHSSAIYRLFERTDSKAIAVSGLSSQTWDDLAARIPLGDRPFASKVLAAGASIFALTSSGTVIIFDSLTFEETNASPISQHERVYKMNTNKAATLLATFGYRTTKIWETATGKCKLSIDNLESRPRPLVMKFTKNNTALLVGTDDSKIWRVNLTTQNGDGVEPHRWELAADLEEPELENHILNASNYMAMDEDGALIAVAYRGHPLSAWETDGPEHINHLWRKRDPTARGEVIDAVWLPQSPEVLGLYIEGVVFRWSPYENEVEEISVGANRLALSPDGSLFATGNGQGKIMVFATATFRLLYQVASQDPVFDMAFSPDSFRFYDIRGSYVNVWEPNVLMSFVEHANAATLDSDSDTTSISTPAPTVFCQRIDAISAMESVQTGGLYFYGTENGIVRACHVQKGHLADIHTSKSFLGIENLTCSADGRYLFFSDASRKIFVKNIIATSVVGAELLGKKITNDTVLDLLCRHDNSRLLVQGAQSLRVLQIPSCEVIHSLELLPEEAERRWIQHPHDTSLLIGFGPATALILDWDLDERHRYSYACLPVDKEGTRNFQAKIDRVIVTHNKNHILIRVIYKEATGSWEAILAYFSTASLCPTQAAMTEGDTTSMAEASSGINTLAQVQPTVLTTHPSVSVRRLLSFLPKDRLVFLSRSYSVCTWQLPSGPLKELFCLPGDWINRDCLDLCSVWDKEKSFLCPRNGEVAIVKCAALV